MGRIAFLTPPNNPTGTTTPHKLNCPQHMRTLDRYLDELISYGGEPYTRAEVIADMQQSGTPQSCIDRWLQGYEHTQRLHDRKAHLTTRVFLTERHHASHKSIR
jgi:hypothetical protein